MDNLELYPYIRSNDFRNIDNLHVILNLIHHFRALGLISIPAQWDQ